MEKREESGRAGHGEEAIEDVVDAVEERDVPRVSWEVRMFDENEPSSGAIVV